MSTPADRAVGLALRQLSVSHGRQCVVHDLDLAAVKPGQLLALVGPNGAGKSSLLKAIAGLLPTAGDVRLDGEAMAGWSLRRRATQIGFMPQSIPDDLGMSVLDALVSISHTSKGGTEDELAAHAMTWLEHLQIAHLALRPLAGLSGGQRQMASLAQALVREPRVLLLDEPTSALDLRHQARVMSAVREFARGPRIAVVVLHDLGLAARWADRMALLHQGSIVADGAPHDVLTPAQLAEVYGEEHASSVAARAGRR